MWLGVFAILGVLAVIAFVTGKSYKDAHSEMATRAEEEARVIAEYSDRTFQAVDILLQELVNRYEVTDWAEIANNRTIWRHLNSVADALPQLRSIWFTDQNGYMQLYSGEWPTPNHDSIDRGYFRAHAFGLVSGLHLAEPLAGKYTGRWFVPVSQAFVARKHSFRGVITAAVEPAYYIPKLREHTACDQCSVTVARSDGVVLMGADPDSGVIDPADVPKERLPDLDRRARDASGSAVFASTALDARLRSELYGLLVKVTVPREAVTALWWDRTRYLFLIGGLAGLGLLFLLFRARAYERALIGARQEAETARAAHDRANHAKSEFLATMSHELRTPLNAVLGFAQMIRDEVMGPGNPQYRRYASDIHDSGSHLLSLLNDVLDLSKIEAGRLDLQEVSVSLDDVFDSTRKLTAGRASQGRVTLDFEQTGLVLNADERALKQMLLNLVTNAIKFTPHGGRVTVNAVADDQTLQLRVKDTGCGMTQDQVAKSLEKFGQSGAPGQQQGEGTGLGLNVTSALASLHGGNLLIDSVPGDGTTVTIALPPERLLTRLGLRPDPEAGPDAEVSRSAVAYESA
jgi:signal transduction histidine kinase